MRKDWPQQAIKVVGALCGVMLVAVFVAFVVALRDSKPFKVSDDYEAVAAASLALGAIAAFAAWRCAARHSALTRFVLGAACFVASSWFTIVTRFAVAGLLDGERWGADFGNLACLREWLSLSRVLLVAEAPVAAVLLLAARYRHRLRGA